MKINFLPGPLALSLVGLTRREQWALRLGARNRRIWRRTHCAATERTAEQNIVPPVHLWWFSATCCSSSGRRSSVDFSSQVRWPDWANGEVEFIITCSTESFLRRALMFTRHLNTKRRCDAVKLYSSSHERPVCMRSEVQRWRKAKLLSALGAILKLSVL